MSESRSLRVKAAQMDHYLECYLMENEDLLATKQEYWKKCELVSIYQKKIKQFQEITGRYL